MMKRREFIQAATTATGVLLATGGLPLFSDLTETQSVFAQSSHISSPRLAQFVDPLPVQTPMKPAGTKEGCPFYRLSMLQLKHKLHRDLPPATMWGYNGTIPGPLLEARKGQPVFVEWSNKLPSRHLFAIDHTLHGAMRPTPDVRTVVHLHGIKVPPEYDGYPTSWLTPGQSYTCYYPNDQAAATLFYHDHADGITRLNVYAGLVGFYLLRDEIEDSLNLPRGPFEIPLAMRDATVLPNGQLYYPGKGTTSMHPVWVPSFYGDVAVVNGKIFPYLEVEPRRYRFRMVNSCTSRYLHLTLSSGLSFYQIGSDGGFLPQPVHVSPLILGPAERADLIIDFSQAKGETITMINTAPETFPGGGQHDIPQFMQFRVTKPLSSPDTSSMPSYIGGLPLYVDSPATKVRDVKLCEKKDAKGNTICMQINGLPFTAPVTEKPKLGSIEIWRIINLTTVTHPIHVHLVQFHVLDRHQFDVDTYNATGKLVYTQPVHPRDPNETGVKDIVKAPGRTVTRIKIRFAGYTGRYIWHCHLLEHEDNDMMRPLEVVP
jgi:spore coat protein A